MTNGLELMADYTFLSKYSQKKPNGELENWRESIDRIYDMHVLKLKSLNLYDDEIQRWIDLAKKFEYNKIILSSQRCRQFAQVDTKSGILKHEAKLYNCTSTFIDRPEVFGEVMYLLLCGCGVGYSLHKEYINKLPVVAYKNDGVFKYEITDDIEGWGESIHVLMNSIFSGYSVDFDYSKIRQEGAMIDGKFKAPGSEPLKKAHQKIIELCAVCIGRKLKPIEVHDILCYIADSVVSGGVRRSAMIALFDKDDDEMIQAKTGSWWTENPQRAMANNSVLTSHEDAMTYNEMKQTLKVVRQFGEPGSVNVLGYDWVVNPCGEIVMRPIFENETGFAFCNLVEINAEKCADVETFYKACEIASFVATVQALYTNFKFISEASKKIAEHDRNIGVSITGIYSNNVLKKEVLRRGSKKVAETNAFWAFNLKINKSRTCTTIKPSGNASTILGLACSGIHPAHDKKYIRRIRIKTNSPEYIALQNTPLVKVLRGNDAVISFPIEIDDNAITKDKITAVEHLSFISMVKHYWINKGSLESKTINHNISATVEVDDDEWDEVAAVIYTHSYLFTGISLLPKMGDQVYDNAPFQRLSNDRLVQEFNDMKDYIESNEIDFIKIMSDRDNFFSGDMVATGCSGGSCELK